MTAWGTDSAAKGRMNNVDAWAKDACAMENQPQVGFTINGRSGKDEWSVIDPRGFRVSVKAEYMFDTLQHSTLVQGQILEPCVWGRCRGHNVLLNTSSSLYEQSLVITRIANSKTPWKSAKIGNRVTLVNGVQGIYMGKYYHVYLQSRLSRTDSPRQNKLKLHDTQSFVILKDQNVKHYKKEVNKELLWINNPRLAVIDSTDQISQKDAELQMNSLLVDSTCTVSYNSWDKTPFIACVSEPHMDNLKLTLEDHSAGDLASALNSTEKCWIKLQSGEWGAHHYDRLKTASSLEVHDHSLMENNVLSAVFKEVIKKNYYGSTSREIQAMERPYDLSEVESYAQLKVSYESSTGNTIHRVI